MTVRKTIVIGAALIIICLFSAPGFAADKDVIGGQIKQVIIDNFNGFEKENMAQVLNTVHTASPVYMATKESASQIFSTYDLKYELVNFRYIGTDGEYAVARAMQKTTKVSGPAFRDNILDLIVIFKQEDGIWKFWTQAILDVKFVK